MKGITEENTRRIRAVREALESGAERKALTDLSAYAYGLLVGIFGDSGGNLTLQDIAFRVDPQLGAFAWFLGEVKLYLTALDSGDNAFVRGYDHQDVQRLLTLLIAYFLDSA